MIILKDYKKVQPHLQQILKYADSHKKQLGFLPKSVFNEQACKGRLWIAVEEKKPNRFLGYLLFGGKYPSLKVFQIFVDPHNRRRRIANDLLNNLIQYGEVNNYLSISARVAADLPANDFWDGIGFHLVRQHPGGQSSDRIINIWIKQLNTPCLFQIMEPQKAPMLPSPYGIYFPHRPISNTPVYVLDINVFFDIVKRREYHKEGKLILHEGLNHQIKVFITPEFSSELKRHTKMGEPDPILEVVEIFPVLSKIDSDLIQQMLPELRSIVFPKKSLCGKDEPRVRSDLVHLIYSIHHGATGFVTRDHDILTAGDQLQKKYSLEILSPADLFQLSSSPHIETTIVQTPVGQECINVSAIAGRERVEVENFLNRLGITSHVSLHEWASGPASNWRRFIARIGQNPIGVALWEKGGRLNPNVDLLLYIDEDKPDVDLVIDHFLETSLRDSEMFESRLITLKVGPQQDRTRTTALQRGFVPFYKGNGEKLAKFTFRGVITKQSWERLVREFDKLTGLKLPSRMPTINEFGNTGIIINDHNNRLITRLKLFEFETLISPALVLCPGREGIILPIRKRFADDFFQAIDEQTSFLPKQEAILHIEKAYFRTPRRENLFQKGSPVLFYLSGTGGGAKAIIGCGRVTFSEILPLEKIEMALKRHGVLSQEELMNIAKPTGKIHVFTFDNFNCYSNPIPFQYLRRKKLISKTNLVTVEPLNFDQLSHLCRCGFGLEKTDA